MIGFEKLFQQVEEAARDLPNLDVVGAVPYREVNRYFARAKLFLNTSDSEGFPNSFLQAWVRQVPVISFFDPDGLITAKDIGIAVPSQSDFVPAISALLQSDNRRMAMGERSRQFVIDHYWSRAVVDEYEELMAERFGIRVSDA